MNRQFFIIKPVLILLFVFNFNIYSRLNNNLKKHFLAAIKLSMFPETTCFDVYYNGQMFKIKGKTSSFKINLNKLKDSLNVLFVCAEDITFNSDENTIKNLVLKKDKDYKFFKLNKIEKDSIIDWQVKKVNLIKKSGKIIIPDDTIIIPLSPSDLKINIENVSYKKNSKVPKLPIIKIESRIKKSELEEKMAKSCLFSMNLRPFHKKEELIDVKKSKSKVSIIV